MVAPPATELIDPWGDMSALSNTDFRADERVAGLDIRDDTLKSVSGDDVAAASIACGVRFLAVDKARRLEEGADADDAFRCRSPVRIGVRMVISNPSSLSKSPV